jgi:copper transport protein
MVRRQEVACLDIARGRAFFALVAIVLLFFPTLAAAHAVLISSTPVQGERLLETPKLLALRFSEAVTRVDATLVSREGAPRKLKTVVTGADVSAELPEPLADGAYAFTWRIVSEDGHPVSASVVFSIGEGSNSSDFNAVTTNAGYCWRNRRAAIRQDAPTAIAVL